MGIWNLLPTYTPFSYTWLIFGKVYFSTEFLDLSFSADQNNCTWHKIERVNTRYEKKKRNKVNTVLIRPDSIQRNGFFTVNRNETRCIEITRKSGARDRVHWETLSSRIPSFALWPPGSFPERFAFRSPRSASRFCRKHQYLYCIMHS